MKKYFRYILIAFLFYPCNYPLCAQFQPAPVVRSNEKTVLDGKIYYIHTVQKGHTLYSISKAYGVTQDAIKAANPNVDLMSLREGIAIRIPESTTTTSPTAPVNKDDFHEHSVRRRETVYSIARKYNVDEDVVYYYNPWAKYGIKQDQTLWIPKKEEMHDISSEARKDDAYYYYTVKPKDTLYSIAKVYGVTVADIIQANPALKDGLKTDQTILIPKIPPEQDAEAEAADTADHEIACISPDPSYVFNVAVMLPFFASHTFEDVYADTLAGEETIIQQQRERGLRGRNFAEFYEGFLLAVDSLKKTGLSVNLHVFDTERDTTKTKKIIRELTGIQPDLIIGPVFAEDVNIAARYARYQGMHLISPLTTRSSHAGFNNSLVQLVPPKQSESYAMANYLHRFSKGRIILVTGKDQISMDNSRRFKEYLLSDMPLNENGEPLAFSNYMLDDSLMSKIGNILSKEEENLVVVFSDNEPDVISLVTRLYQRASQHRIILFGLPSWQGWTNIDLNYFHTLRLHLISPFYTDYNSKSILNYLKKTRSYYGYEPYEVYSQGYNFSMLGYDIGMYFLSALKKYGRNFMPCVQSMNVEPLLSKFNFYQLQSGAYINNSYNLIEYGPDFSVERTGMVVGMPIEK